MEDPRTVGWAVLLENLVLVHPRKVMSRKESNIAMDHRGTSEHISSKIGCVPPSSRKVTESEVEGPEEATTRTSL